MSNENFRLLKGRFCAFALDFFPLHLQLENSLVALVKGKVIKEFKIMLNIYIYIYVNFILPCTDNAERPVYSERSLTFGYFFRKLYADISYYFEFKAPNLR